MLNEFWFSAAAYGANHDLYMVAAFINLTYPFVTMVPVVLMVEEETLKGKARVCVFSGVGFTVGTLLFLKFIKPLLDIHAVTH